MLADFLVLLKLHKNVYTLFVIYLANMNIHAGIKHLGLKNVQLTPFLKVHSRTKDLLIILSTFLRNWRYANILEMGVEQCKFPTENK
jgi:hypothetical protein